MRARLHSHPWPGQRGRGGPGTLAGGHCCRPAGLRGLVAAGFPASGFRSQQDCSGLVYGPDGPSDNCDNVGPGTCHRALWTWPGPFPGSVAEGARASSGGGPGQAGSVSASTSRARGGGDRARSTGSHTTLETARSWVQLSAHRFLTAGGDGEGADTVSPVTERVDVPEPSPPSGGPLPSAEATGGGGRLCSQTLPPGIRDSGKHFPLLFSSEGGHARNSASQRPAWAPPQPAALTVASRAILVVRPPQVAGCCSSGLERGAAAGDPAPAHPPRGNQALG